MANVADVLIACLFPSCFSAEISTKFAEREFCLAQRPCLTCVTSIFCDKCVAFAVRRDSNKLFGIEENVGETFVAAWYCCCFSNADVYHRLTTKRHAPLSAPSVQKSGTRRLRL